MFVFQATSSLLIIASLIWGASCGKSPLVQSEKVAARSEVNLPTSSPTPPTSPGDNRKNQWEDEKRKLLQANYPLTSSTRIDVDGDNVADTITYGVKRWEDDFEGRLTIISSKGKELWDHEFFMASRDLAKFLAEVLEYENSSQWVASVFTVGAPYRFEFERIKIKADAIGDEQIEHAAKIHKTSATKLKKEILNQKVNRTFSYRAEWREDLMLLVYIPSLKYFVCYSRGY